MATPVAADAIVDYVSAQTASYGEICRTLRAEIDSALPRAAAKIWHGSPVWFVGENPVVGFHITAKRGVNLLFWNGQGFGEPALEAIGKFKAAQIQFNNVAQIERAALRRWLKRARMDIWDYRGYFLAQKARQKKSKA